jgi:hypothetical protein
MTVTLSIEIELGWSTPRTVSSQGPPLSSERATETEYLSRLLEKADEAGIKITFDIVGHLLEKSCDGNHSGPYSDDWFSVDPGTCRGTNPDFYAPDLIDQIEAADMKHEIGTHTYSHIHCDRETPDTLATELRRSRERHQQYGLAPPVSFVPPNHKSPSRRVCREEGIKIIRRPFPEYSNPEGGIQSFYWTLQRSHPVRESESANGIVETYCTPHPSLTEGYLATGTHQPRPEYRHIPLKIRQWRHYRYLINAVEAAVEADSEVHLWTHLYNMANDEQYPPIASFLDYLADEYKKGRIQVTRMNDLANSHIRSDSTLCRND